MRRAQEKGEVGGSACRGATRPKSALDGKAADHQLPALVEGGSRGSWGRTLSVIIRSAATPPPGSWGLFLQLQGLDRKLRLLLP